MCCCFFGFFVFFFLFFFFGGGGEKKEEYSRKIVIKVWVFRRWIAWASQNQASLVIIIDFLLSWAAPPPPPPPPPRPFYLFDSISTVHEVALMCHAYSTTTSYYSLKLGIIPGAALRVSFEGPVNQTGFYWMEVEMRSSACRRAIALQGVYDKKEYVPFFLIREKVQNWGFFFPFYIFAIKSSSYFVF